MVLPPAIRNTTFRAALTFIGIAQALDVLSTQTALAHGSIELNPAALYLQQTLGPVYWGAPKLLMGAIAIAIAARLSPHLITPPVFWTALVIAKLYAIVILNNYLQLV